MKQLLLDMDAFKTKISGLEDILDDVVQDTQLQDILRTMSLENNYREIVNTILTTQQDTCPLRQINMSRNQKLLSIKRFVNSISQVDSVDNQTRPTMFSPPIQKGQMIFVDFAGIGAELDKQHFAIVWDDVKSTQDKVVIIPVKSEKPQYKEYPNSFSIGTVDFFTKETWVDVRELTAISRKRISGYQFESSPGANDHKEAYLTPEQENRIKDAFRIYWGMQKTLLDRILENNKERVPTFLNPNLQLPHLFRSVKSFKTNANRTRTEYLLYNDNTVYVINWKNTITQITQGKRNQLIKKIAYASAIIQGSTLVSDRTQSRMTSYNDLQIM